MFHVHWPELLVRAGSAPRRVVKAALLLTLVVRLSVLRTPVVRTVHNETPHEPGSRLERTVLALLDRRVRTYVALNPFTALPDGVDAVVIPHSHYVGRFPTAEVMPVPGRLISCGLLRPYKGVEDLLAVVTGMTREPLSVHVVGKPLNAEFADVLQSAAAADPRVDLTLSFVADELLAQEMGASELVVLPYHRMHNSGMLILALSLGRPVLVPRNEVTEWIADEVGPGWVSFFDGEVDAAVLEEALDQAPAVLAGEAPRFSARSWEESGEQYAAVYRSVAL
ncbi:glycosyltransferase [Aeromicrobium alkaliterrae]|uniref:glycosyltransferase n=1 Tax=Aeromicrobium alkaliterrae TaxID=302168 RepID=UPI0031D12322